jgi:phage terminase large subunit-like protein
MRSKAWLVSAAGVAAVCLLATRAAPAPAAMYWGATISGEPYGQAQNAPLNQSAWDLFERHAGKKVALLNMGQKWAAFDSAQMDATWSRGTIPVVTMGLPEGVTLEQVAAGDQDSAIRAWAAAARDWGHPFFFAPWWEMNGAWYSWGRNPNFVAAWRRFHGLVEAEGATNVTWSWISNSLWYDPDSDPSPYYPGDAYVDWTGIDTYNWGRNPAQPDRWINPDQAITPTLSRIREIAPAKPVIILENASTEYGGNKTDWIAEMLGTYLPHHPEIKAYLWFNWNFQKSNGLRTDWPIESSATAQQAFRAGIQSSIYLSRASSPQDLQRVPLPAPPPGEGASQLDLSPVGQDGGPPQVAVAPDGTATVVWSGLSGGTHEVYARRIAPGGAAGPIERLSEPGEDALCPQVAVAPDGTATVVWIRSDGAYFLVQARRIAPNGVLEATESLSATGRDAAEPQLAVGPDGVATVVWKRFDGSHFLIKERRIAADGTVEEAGTHNLSATGQDAVEPQVAVAPDGAATVVWSRFDGANSVIQERRIAPDDAPAPDVDDLSAAGQNAVDPAVVAGPDGSATVVWARSDSSNSIVQERRVSAGGAPDAITNSLSASGGDAAEPQPAVSPDGTVTVVWDRFDGSNFVVQARRLSPSGSPEPNATTLSAAGGDAAEPAVAIGPQGGGTVLWSRFDGSDFIVQRRDIGDDGVPASQVADLSAPGQSAGAARPAPGAHTTAIWRRSNGANDIVQGSPAAAPGTPAASLTPGSHDFGSVALGSGPSRPTLFQLTSIGGAPLSVASISVAGADRDQFVISGTESCLIAPLAPGAGCQFSVAFEPSSVGARTATVEVVSDDAASPARGPLAGAGILPPSSGAPFPEPSDPVPAQPFAPGATAIGNTFSIGRPVRNRRNGTARLPVILPGAGTLIAAGPRITTVNVSEGGTVMLKVRVWGRKSGLLNRRGTIVIGLVLTFVPHGGEASTRIRWLKLVKARQARRPRRARTRLHRAVPVARRR